jgi:hypothetical protein
MSIIRQGILSSDLDAPVTSPILNLDFTNSQSLDSKITFTCGSIRTFVIRMDCLRQNKQIFQDSQQRN